jgi:hypothetical protein
VVDHPLVAADENGPWADEGFGERFIAAARFREPAARFREPAARFREPAARMREPGTRDWSCAAPPALPPPRRRSTDGGRSISGRRARPWLVFAAAAIVVTFAQLPSDGTPTWASGTPLQLVGVGDRPSAQRAQSRLPLGSPLPAPPAGGPHAFSSLQPNGSDPVAYDPCRPLRFVVNRRTVPPGGDALLGEAIARISEVTGLRFEAEGITAEPPTEQREVYQRRRYGDRWAPILIAWSDPAEVPMLAGDIAGIGGSVRVPSSRRDPTLVYVSGIVALDGPQLAELLAHADGRAHVRGVIIHELAHLVGLNHVEDPSQLMHAWSAQTELQAGDLTGLARLGGGRCVDTL